MSCLCRSCVDFMYNARIMTGMVRPEIDEDIIEMLSEIIDESVEVPLSSDELSLNKQFRILVEAHYEYMNENESNRIDENYGG